MNWLKVLGVLVPLGIALSTLGALVAFGTGVADVPASLTTPSLAAGIALVVVVMGLVCLLGAKSKEWRANPYW
jgi:hypothetical protein